MHTVYMMSAVLYLMLHGVIWYSLARHHSRFVSWWGFSGVVTAAGWGLVAGGGLLPDGVLFIGAQLLIALGTYGRQYALRSLDEPVSERWVRGQGLFFLALLGCDAYLYATQAPASQWQLVFFAFYAFNAIDFLRAGQNIEDMRDTSGAVLVQSGGLVLALSMGFKALALWTGWGTPGLYDWGWDQGVVFVGQILGVGLLNIGFLQILLDQFQHERAHVEHALYLQRARAAEAQQQTMDLATLLREREEIIRQLTLSNKTAGMGALVASFAHELNQPLTATLLHGELIQSHLKRALDEQQAPDAAMLQTVSDAIVSDTQRAGEIIRKLRNLFRISTGEFERIDFNELVRDMLDLVQARADRTGVVMDAQLEPRLTLMGDATQLQQVVLNLFNNAIDAMQANVGQVRRLIVRSRTTADALQLMVEDTGKGIAPELQDEVFSLFKTTKSHGMGVGLWLSQSIVETHGGWLRFQSEPGHGTVFTLNLPTHRDVVMM